MEYRGKHYTIIQGSNRVDAIFSCCSRSLRRFQNRRAPGYLGSLIRKSLRKIDVILLHNVEHCCLGELAMVLGK